MAGVAGGARQGWIGKTVSRKQEYTFIRNLDLSIRKLNINVSFECKIITHALFRINYPACALRALGLFLADGAPTVGWGKEMYKSQID